MFSAQPIPEISICIAVYNLEKYIGECIESTLKQNFEDYEVVVVDNGSTDRSVEICRAYEKKYPDKIRFFALPQPTQIVRAHIYAVKQAKGRYIHLIDGDDCVVENYLSRMEKIITEKEPDLILGNFECILEDGVSNYKDVLLEEKFINGVPYGQALEYLLDRPYFNRYVWRFVVKREMFDLVDFSGDVAHLTYVDTLKATKWLFHASSIYYEQEAIYHYRRRAQSTTSRRTGKTAIDALKTAIAIPYFVTEGLSKGRCRLFFQKNQIHVWQHVQMFTSEWDFLDTYEWDELEHYIIEHDAWLEKWMEFDLPQLKQWIKIIRQRDIKCHLEHEEKHLIEQVKRAQGEKKQCYIFPYGSMAESRRRTLEHKGIFIRGYLDNDKQKSGMQFEGITCRLPELLTKAECSQGVFVIASYYPEVIATIVKQLLHKGISKEKIIV